jgi:hypothetical protein
MFRNDPLNCYVESVPGIHWNHQSTVGWWGVGGPVV